MRKITRRSFLAAPAACGAAAALTACGGSSASSAAASSAAPASSAAASAAADGQKFTIGICQLVQHAALDAATQGFEDALTASFGENVTFDFQNAQGDSATCATITNGFVSSGVDLIMANATPALQAAQSATDSIPVLGTSVTEYGVALGLTDFDGTVGGNISGTSDLAPLDQQAEMIVEWMPEAKKVGLLYCSAEANSQYQVDEVQKYLEAKGVTATQYAFSDSNEIWWLETVGGHHWIAKRVPDEAYVTMPNQLGIDEFDLEDALGDQEAHMCSEDLAEFIETNHLDLAVENTTPFNPRDAFGSHSDSDHVYNTPRAWYMQRFLNPYDEVWDGPDADHKPTSDDIPWARQPERKVTIEDIKYVLSSHYQGTPFDPYGQLGDERTRHMYRTIGINRQSQLAVMQIRPYRPQASRAIQWMAYGSNPFNTLVPFFPNVDTTPAYLEDTTTRVTSENFYWANRIIAALCDGAFRSTSNAVERYQEKTGAMGHRLVAATDEQIARLGLTGAEEAAQSAAEEEFEADNVDGDVQPMTPDETIAALRNPEVREILAAANQTMADQLKEETEKLLDSVLYTRSMEMKNGFHMSDF